MKPSLLYILFFFLLFCFFFFFFAMLLSMFFSYSPCLFCRILERERERSLHIEFYFVGGWNGMANFQCRSLAYGVYV
jgi:hypothetical protein